MHINQLKIEILTNCQEHIHALALLWHEETSRQWAPDASIEKAKQKLIEHLNNEKLPLAFVALVDNTPVGMACLRETDGIQPGVAPWLGSLVVHPDYRGQKIGEALIVEVKCRAKKMNYDTLYLLAFDPTIPAWYGRLNWKVIGRDKLFNHPVTVMSINV